MDKQVQQALANLGATFGPFDGLYTLIEPAAAEKIGAWADHYPKYDQVVGYSNLGHLFLRDTRDNEYIVLHPYKAAAKSYGSFESLSKFEQEVLQEIGFALFVLRADHVAEVQEFLGPLGAEEIYIPCPYPFLGGSDLPETYEKGNVWGCAAIVAAMQGLE